MEFGLKGRHRFVADGRSRHSGLWALVHSYFFLLQNGECVQLLWHPHCGCMVEFDACEGASDLLHDLLNVARFYVCMYMLNYTRCAVNMRN